MLYDFARGPLENDGSACVACVFDYALMELFCVFAYGGLNVSGMCL